MKIPLAYLVECLTHAAYQTKAVELFGEFARFS